MAKRSDFPRKAKNFYPTPESAVIPLVNWLGWPAEFVEPCAGDGQLVYILAKYGFTCVRATDLEPSSLYIPARDAFDYTEGPLFITNPPWPSPGSKGEPVISMAIHLSNIAPTWFLLSADFAHNKYFKQLRERCRIILSVGRVSWEGNGVSGKDNCAWYLFDTPITGSYPVFIPQD